MKRRGMGEGNIRQRPHDGRWEARYYLPDGSRRSIMGKTRTEVAKKLADALRDLDRGVTAPKDGRVTFGAYLDNWLATKKPDVEHSYWVRCEQYIRVHVKPSLGKIPLVKLTPNQLNALYAKKLDEIAPNTVRHLHATIHVALEDALRLDLVARNVADVVLDRGELRITSALKDVGGQKWLGRPKTAHSRRTIPLTPLAIQPLKRHKLKQAEERLANGAAGDCRMGTCRDSFY